MRRAARVDACHPQVVRALRRLGYHVRSLAQLGDGLEDLLVGVHLPRPAWILVECKTPSNTGRVTYRPDQLTWYTETRGMPRLIVTSAQEAVMLVRQFEETGEHHG